MTVRETVDARKERYGAKDLPELFRGATRVIAARGKKEQVFDPRSKEDAAELAKAVLGPTGNLRAPAMRLGKTWLVGFGEETYERIFG